jgi:hypothetical protein
MAYYLRISEVNGFETPWHLFKRAGMDAHEWRTRGARTDKIAIIAKCRKEHLDRIAYSTRDSARPFRLLGHPVNSTDIEPERPKLCPQCVYEKKFVEAHWDLAYMVACPVHYRWATTACLACGKRLSLFRRGLLICHCGATLQHSNDTDIPPSLGCLLTIVRARVLPLLPFADFEIGLPVLELHRLELHTLLRVIEVVGRCELIALGKDVKEVAAQDIVCAAAEVLSTWPSNFNRLLQALAIRNKSARGIREQFAPLYTALLKRGRGESPGSLDFIREAFLRFVTYEWNGRRVDPRTLQEVSTKVGRLFVSGNELARRLNIDPRTVKRHAKIYSQKITRGPQLTYAVNTDCVSTDFQSAHKVIRIRQAAAEIGIPVNVLRALKESGDFEVKHQMPMQAGFREADVVAFKSRISALVPTGPHSSGVGDVGSLGTCMAGSRYSIGEKITVIRKVLDRSLPIVGQKHDGVKGLMVSSAALSAIIRGERSTIHGPVMSGKEAAKAIGCEFVILCELVKGGVITGEKTGKQWKVAVSSVAEFCRTYVSLAAVASELMTTSTRLRNLCREEGIQVLIAKRASKSPQPFIRLCDRSKLVRNGERS